MNKLLHFATICIGVTAALLALTAIVMTERANRADKNNKSNIVLHELDPDSKYFSGKFIPDKYKITPYLYYTTK